MTADTFLGLLFLGSLITLPILLHKLQKGKKSWIVTLGGGLFGTCLLFAAGSSILTQGNGPSSSRQAEYIEMIHPFVNQSLGMMSVGQFESMTYQQYKDMHLGACKASANLLAMSTDRDKHTPFSDAECVQLMDLTRTYAKKLKDRAPAATTQDDTFSGVRACYARNVSSIQTCCAQYKVNDAKCDEYTTRISHILANEISNQ